MNTQEFDEFLKENSEHPTQIFIHPLIWNGYWRIAKTNRTLRWIGRKFHNKYIYWLGLQIRWESGIKELLK